MNLFWTFYYKWLAKDAAKPQTEAEKQVDAHVTTTLGPLVK